MCYDELAPCTAHEEQSNGWYGMASKQGTNSPRGEQIPRVGNKFTGSKKIVPKEFVPQSSRGTPGNKIPSYTGTNPRTIVPAFSFRKESLATGKLLLSKFFQENFNGRKTFTRKISAGTPRADVLK